MVKNNTRNKKMELSYILNNETRNTRHNELNVSLNDILTKSLVFTGTSVLLNRTIPIRSLKTIIKRKNKQEIFNSMKKIELFKHVQNTYMSNLINILNKQLG